jgi:hypothetical protein
MSIRLAVSELKHAHAHEPCQNTHTHSASKNVQQRIQITLIVKIGLCCNTIAISQQTFH